VLSIGNAKSFFQGENLTGEWGGVRTDLSESGMNLIGSYKLEGWYVPNGGKGKQSGYYIQNLDLDLLIDIEKLIGIEGGLFLFDWQMMNGQAPNAIVVNSIQGISNIETWNNYLIYELWYQQSFFKEKFSILFGLLDLNSEFDLKPSKGLFLTPAHGIGTDYAGTGINGPSIFPVTSLALRARVQITDEWGLKAAIFDGVPGDTANPVGTHILLRESDGLLVAFETDLIISGSTDERLHSHFAVGSWYYTDSYFSFVSDIKQWGIYAFVEYPLFVEKRDMSQGLSSSLRIGYSDPRSNITDFFLGAALEYKGLFYGRDNDFAGIGFAFSKISDEFKKEIEVSENIVFPKYDSSFEIFYSIRLTPFFAIQPTFQYFITPAFNIKNDNYFVGGIRTSLSL